jgi:hypothetical protein
MNSLPSDVLFSLFSFQCQPIIISFFSAYLRTGTFIDMAADSGSLESRDSAPH